MLAGVHHCVIKEFQLIVELIHLSLESPTFGASTSWQNLHHEDKGTSIATPQKES